LSSSQEEVIADFGRESYQTQMLQYIGK